MFNPLVIWREFLARSNDDRIKVFGIAILVALVCSVVVSMASIALRPMQEAHLVAEREARMAAMLDTLPGMREIMEEAGVDRLETRLVDLETGVFAVGVDPETYDVQAALNDPEESLAIPPEIDVAGLRRRALYAPVHLLESNGELLLIVLPVSATGYQSTVRAMLALEADLRTVAALTIIEQAETAGIGSRVEDPDWLALWPGKQVANDAGEIVISVVRGKGSGPHEVDGISGATRTGSSVGNMLTYWLGDHGFGPFLDNLSRGEL